MPAQAPSYTLPTVKLITLSKLFSDDYIFDLPWYQRGYAWTTEHAVCLLEDILDAVARRANGEDYYRLGLISLAQRAPASEAEIIDGQQRIITLTVLIAVLRDLLDDAAMCARLNACVWTSHSGQVLPRLTAQGSVNAVLLNHVQLDGTTASALTPEEEDELNANESNVVINRNALRDRLHGTSQSDLATLAAYLLDHCYPIIEVNVNEEVAFRTFTKTQGRGLQLGSADLFKANVLSCVPHEERDECALIWDDCAARLGTPGVKQLFRHLRDIALCKQKLKPVEDELTASYDIAATAASFVRNVLEPTAERMLAMGKCEIVDVPNADLINRRLQYLSWVQHDSWMAPAIYWIDVLGLKHAQTAEFFTMLERFAYGHMLAQTHTDPRNKAYYGVIASIKRGDVLEPGGPLSVSNDVIDATAKYLRSSNFCKRSLKSYVLLRANEAMGNDDRPTSVPFGTAEHIFPTKARRRGGWGAKLKAKATAAAYVNRLGNTTLLIKADNNDAGNKDFAAKCKIYETSNFEMSRRLCDVKVWDADAIDARTEEIIQLLFAAWNFPYRPR